MAEAQASQQRHNYAEYLTWDDGVRRELIDGQTFVMSPTPSWAHQELVMALGAQLHFQLRGQPCRVIAAPFDVRLLEKNQKDDEISTVVQPDLAVVCDAARLDARGCRGAPDWMIEILSPATASHDHVRKRQLYERHGVREYWLVHPVDRVVTIYRLTAEGSFDAAITLATEGELSPAVLPDLTIDWQEAFAKVPPPDVG